MGDGGALTIRSSEHDSRLRRLRWFGIDRDTLQRFGSEGYDWQYDITEVGFRYPMNDIQAAIGLAQLRYLDEENSHRAEVAEKYRERLSNVPGVELSKYKDDRTSSYHLFYILAEGRDQLAEKLRSAGVDVGVHYRRNDQYHMYEEQNLPNADYFWRRTLSLPMHLELTDKHIDFVTDIIMKGW